MRVATFSARGMHAGRVVPLRQIKGPQNWRVVLKIDAKDPAAVTDDNPEGRVSDEHIILSKGRCELSDMAANVIASINELTPEGIPVENAYMDFFCVKGRH